VFSIVSTLEVYILIQIIMPFNFVGENIREFFFRAVALTFEAAILREIEFQDILCNSYSVVLGLRSEVNDLNHLLTKAPYLSCNTISNNIISINIYQSNK
jgi:hypothetical protein